MNIKGALHRVISFWNGHCWNLIPENDGRFRALSTLRSQQSSMPFRSDINQKRVQLFGENQSDFFVSPAV